MKLPIWSTLFHISKSFQSDLCRGGRGGAAVAAALQPAWERKLTGDVTLSIFAKYISDYCPSEGNY